MYLTINQIKPAQGKWLVKKVAHFFQTVEIDKMVDQTKLDELYVLIGAPKVLGLDGAAQSFIPRLSSLKQRVG